MRYARSECQLHVRCVATASVKPQPQTFACTVWEVGVGAVVLQNVYKAGGVVLKWCGANVVQQRRQYNHVKVG